MGQNYYVLLLRLFQTSVHKTVGQMEVVHNTKRLSKNYLAPVIYSYTVGVEMSVPPTPFSSSIFIVIVRLQDCIFKY